MVYVYSLCDVFYGSFYFEGINKKFGKFEFNASKFPNFKQGTFALIVEENNQIIKIVIDTKDDNLYYLESLEWCNFYGKINYFKDTIPNNYIDKVVPIGPSFGVKMWNFPQTLFFAVRNYFISKNQITNKREFVANYWRQFKRLPLSFYNKSKSDNNYVYFIASLWQNDKETNNNRAKFIEACKVNNKIDFVGGFAPRKDNNDFGFENLILQNSITLKKYIENIKKSAIVFNTPAVLFCHGWKLGEFLALGKVIITTNHVNVLPAELIDYEHLLYLDHEKNIEFKIDEILSNPELKSKLETNSRQYYDDNLSPEKVIEKLVKKAIS